eukprot:9497776-Pyramimonas_sp.AAC.1
MALRQADIPMEGTEQPPVLAEKDITPHILAHVVEAHQAVQFAVPGGWHLSCRRDEQGLVIAWQI